MTSWAISWERRAVKELEAVAKPHRRRIIEAVEKLAQDPWAAQALSGEWKGLRRHRVGSYRIIYAADEGQLRILVVRVGGRPVARSRAGI